VHDTIELEKRGVPTTVIITQAFRNACVFQFRAKGMDGHAYVELPHPISNFPPEKMRELTLRHVATAVRQITA
jgi:hypothetical protein